MKKVSVSATNDICPQTLFVYGSMNEDGTPGFRIVLLVQLLLVRPAWRDMCHWWK